MTYSPSQLPVYLSFSPDILLSTQKKFSLLKVVGSFLLFQVIACNLVFATDERQNEECYSSQQLTKQQEENEGSNYLYPKLVQLHQYHRKLHQQDINSLEASAEIEQLHNQLHQEQGNNSSSSGLTEIDHFHQNLHQEEQRQAAYAKSNYH